MKVLKRYKVFLALLFANGVLFMVYPKIGLKAAGISVMNLIEMIAVLPPIFILLGLLDVWVQRETMIKLMGERSGLLGVLMAFLLGSFAAGPLYAAFPVAGVLLKKGCKLSNILIFIGAWSTTKIPLLLFEASSMGPRFMGTRLVVDVLGIVIMAYILERAMTLDEKEVIYEKFQSV